jgi:flagellar basal body-associated protein FliL
MFWTGDMEASMSKTPAKRDNALIIILVLAVVTALSMLAGFFWKSNQSGELTSTQPTTKSPATGEADCKKAGGEWDSKMNMCMEKKM